jgi:hypothetical protein
MFAPNQGAPIHQEDAGPMAHQETELKDMIIQLQDGTRIHVMRDEHDRLVTTGFEGAGKHAGRTLDQGLTIVGFGPWPTWSYNLSQRVATRPDEESGLFEPERLFVLREQYAFFTGAGVDAAKPLSFGPIHKVWWVGTEDVVQARRGGWH